MVESVPLDVVAHFDRIFWPGSIAAGWLDIWQLEIIVRETLAALVRNEVALELNTRFLTHTPGWNSAIATVLRWFREAGGRYVLVNSDAHSTIEIGRHLAVAQGLLRAAGYESAATLQQLKRPPTSMPSTLFQAT